MIKIGFREAQLMVLGADRLHRHGNVELNNLQRFSIGDNVEVIEISLHRPVVVIKIAECVESYVPIESLSEKVVDACIDILREVAFNVDQEFARSVEE